MLESASDAEPTMEAKIATPMSNTVELKTT
jgi:hypothetical protein